MVDLSKPITIKPGISITEELENILAHEPVSSILVEAGAGTGKTTSLVEYTKKWWKYKALYLSFNASVAKEAKMRFPAHVTAMTAHGYAYRALNVGKYKSRLVGRIRKPHIREAKINLNTPYLTEDQMIKAVLNGIENYTNDAGSILKAKHCKLDFVPRQTQEKIMPIIGKAIKSFVDYENGNLPFTHDCYLKNLEINGQMGAEYDYIMVDEAQDLNPILLSLIKRSGRPLIVVGDRKQSIYAFRGSVDAMSEIEAPRLPLTQSWRFGAPVDKLANHILSKTIKKTEFQIKGKPDKKTEIVIYEGLAERNSLILSRTNSRLFEGLIGLKKPFHVIGGFEFMATQLLSALALLLGKRQDIKDQLVMSYRTWSEMVKDSEEGDDPEVRRIVNIIEDYGLELPNIIERLRGLHKEYRAQAYITLSTAHKAKGLEESNVIILDDFPSIAELQAKKIEKKITNIEYDQELHLMYVAVTRAMDKLNLPISMYESFKKVIED